MGYHFADVDQFVPVYVLRTYLATLCEAAEQNGMGHLTVSEVLENAMSMAVEDWSKDYHIPRNVYKGRGK